MAKQYKIIKATYEKLVGVIFECAILNNMNAPKWFRDFVEKQFKPDIADIKVRVSNLEARMMNVETRLDTVIEINNLKTELPNQTNHS